MGKREAENVERAERRQVHTLKTWPQYLDAIGNGTKTFEVRKNDRGFCVGDLLMLREWSMARGEWGDRWLCCFVSYVLEGGRFGIEPGHCVLGLKLPANHVWPPSAL